MARGLLDADGRPLDPVERALAEMAARVAECVFGNPADERVRQLRESVTGESAPPAPISGLAAWLEKGAP